MPVGTAEAFDIPLPICKEQVPIVVLVADGVYRAPEIKDGQAVVCGAAAEQQRQAE
jgi:hypothetical protein